MCLLLIGKQELPGRWIIVVGELKPAQCTGRFQFTGVNSSSIRYHSPSTSSR